MNRRILVITTLLTCLFVAQAMALTPGRVTMLVVPARYSVMQVAFDIAQKHAVALVSYQGDATSEAPLLHAWNGKEWIKISIEEYADASFLQVTPGETLLIGDEQLLPSILTQSISSWCSKVTVIPSIDTSTLVNSFAKEFSFKTGEWEWFAKRYNLTLKDENAARRKASWYDQPSYEDKYTPEVKGWFGLRKTAPAPVKIIEPSSSTSEVVPQMQAPLAVPVPQSEPLPAGADADVSVPTAAPAAEAAFTASPMPEEDARKALQAPPPVVENVSTDQPVAPATAEPEVQPLSSDVQSQPEDLGMGLQ